ncbi:MAG: cobyric acid synthase [Lachnospiraceae bacterium]|nr:cobyric acid synthase [Lachnospiraceae bacterium]
MGKSMMIQGTMANVGKSTLIAGLSRAFCQDGYKVAPFCPKSMALRTFITNDGKEISKMQALQAEAARIQPESVMNPILFKAVNSSEMQVVVKGEVYGQMPVSEYAKQRKYMEDAILSSYGELSKKYDIVIMEGAGSPVEFILDGEDMANAGIAKRTKTPVLLMGDMDRGGAMAQLLGTAGLFDEEAKKCLKGFLLNKFRGDRKSLLTMIRLTEQKGQVPVLGIFPYLYSSIDDIEEFNGQYEKENSNPVVDITVIHFPHIESYVEFNPLECVEEVSLHYAASLSEVGDPDFLILPHSTDPVADLLWMRRNGLETRIMQHVFRDKPVLGICSGCQMLGEELIGTDGTQIHGMGFLTDASETENNEKREENVYGTKEKGVFSHEEILKRIVRSILKEKGLNSSRMEHFTLAQYRENQYDRLADVVRECLNLEQIYEMIQKGI